MAKTVLITAPATEPITPDELKTHLRIDDPIEDAYLSGLITVARKHLEEIHWTQFVTATWDEYFDRFSSPLRLTRPPLISISTVKYTDTGGTLQTLADTVYEADDIDGVGGVRLKYQQTWPVGVRGHADVVVVQFTAGYGAASAVPEPIKQAIKLYASFLYWNREPTTYEQQAIDTSMGPYSFRELRR